MAGLDLDGLRHLRDREREAVLEHAGEPALLIGREVEDDDERDAVDLGEPGEERLEGLDASGRGAQTGHDDGSTVGPRRIVGCGAVGRVGVHRMRQRG